MNLTLLLATAFISSQAPEALPDFSRSTAAVSPAEPRAGDVIRYDLQVTNSGAPAGTSRISSELPRGYLIDFGGGCEAAKLDPETRHAVWYEGPIATGETKTCTIRMLSRRTSAGTQANVHTAISAFRPEAYWRFSSEAELGSVPDPHRVRVGSFFVSRAGIAVLSFLGVFLLGIPVLSTHTPAGRRPGTADILRAWVWRAWGACILCFGFLALFASLAYDDYRAATQYRETQCTVFDQEMTWKETRGTRGGPNVPVYAAVFAVRYEVDGALTFSSGFGTPTRLSFGSQGPASRAIEQFRIGTTHPCWYDPDDVKAVLLDRSPGGAYFFAAIPLVTLLYAGAVLRRGLRRG